MPAGIEILGARELEKALLQIQTKAAKKVVRKATRDGAKVIGTRAKANAAGLVGGSLGGAIRKALVVRAQRRQRRGAYGVNVLVNPNRADQFVYHTKAGRRHFIPNAVEYGHVAPGKAGTKGAPKVVRPKPFMRNACDTAGQQAVRTVEQAMWTGIEKAARDAPKVT